MRQISSFTEKETPVQNMGVLFSVTQWVLVEMESNPSQSFIAQLSFDTPDNAISHILPM